LGAGVFPSGVVAAVIGRWANEVQGDRKSRPYYIRTGCAFLGVEGCVMAILAPDGWENPDVFASRFVAVVAVVAV